MTTHKDEIVEQLRHLPTFYDRDRQQYLGITLEFRDVLIEQASAIEALQAKMRMIISHASGGHLSKPEDIDRSTNDICVEISRHHNRIWEQAPSLSKEADA